MLSVTALGTRQECVPHFGSNQEGPVEWELRAVGNELRTVIHSFAVLVRSLDFILKEQKAEEASQWLAEVIGSAFQKDGPPAWVVVEEWVVRSKARGKQRQDAFRSPGERRCGQKLEE